MRSRAGDKSHVGAPLHSVKELLSRYAPALTRITEKAGKQGFWSTWLAAHLPPDMQQKISGVTEREGTVVVFAESAALMADAMGVTLDRLTFDVEFTEATGDSDLAGAVIESDQRDQRGAAVRGGGDGPDHDRRHRSVVELVEIADGLVPPLLAVPNGEGMQRAIRRHDVQRFAGPCPTVSSSANSSTISTTSAR